MASVRFTDVQARPSEFLDLTSLTLDEFQQSLLLDSGGLGSNAVREVQCLFKAIEKEGLQGGKDDNNAVGRPRQIHDPGIQQEPQVFTPLQSPIN